MRERERERGTFLYLPLIHCSNSQYCYSKLNSFGHANVPDAHTRLAAAFVRFQVLKVARMKMITLLGCKAGLPVEKNTKILFASILP